MEDSDATLMQIGDAAERTEMSLPTLRHWEEVGLVIPSARSNGGFRLYSEADITRIHMVKSMKPLDLTLEEIRELLELLERTDSQPATAEYERLVKHYTERTRSCISRVHRHLAYATELLGMLEARLPASSDASGVSQR